MKTLCTLLLFLTSSLLAKGVKIGADFLYWKTFQDDMDVASLVHFGGGGNTTVINSEIVTPNFNPHTGFRLFVDWPAHCTPWNLEVSFTRITADNSQTTVAEANSGIALNAISFPIFTVLTQNNFTFSNLTTHWSSSVNYLDIDLNHCHCQNNFFELHSHMGLRGMWMWERLGLSGFSPSGEGAFFESRFTQRYQGYGLEAGLDGYIHLGCGFSLYGQLGGSLLYSKLALSERLKVFTPTENFDIGGSPELWHFTPTIDGFIGVRYATCLWSHPAEVHIGWDQHIIFNANHFKISGYSDLHLQGLTLGGSLSF